MEYLSPRGDRWVLAVSPGRVGGEVARESPGETPGRVGNNIPCVEIFQAGHRHSHVGKQLTLPTPGRPVPRGPLYRRGNGGLEFQALVWVTCRGGGGPGDWAQAAPPCGLIFSAQSFPGTWEVYPASPVEVGTKVRGSSAG